MRAAEPSRGAPDAEQFANDRYFADWPVTPEAPRTPDECIRFAGRVAEAYVKAERTALLEALKRGHAHFLQNDKLDYEDREILDEMWAAIRKTEGADV